MKAKDLIIAVLSMILKIAVAIFVVIAIYRGATLAYDYGYRVFEEPPMSTFGREIRVTITENMSPKKMGEMLLSKGLIRDDKLFILQYYTSDFREDLIPGEYILSTSMTVEEMLEEMTKEQKIIEAEDEELDGELAPIVEDEDAEATEE